MFINLIQEVNRVFTRLSGFYVKNGWDTVVEIHNISTDFSNFTIQLINGLEEVLMGLFTKLAEVLQTGAGVLFWITLWVGWFVCSGWGDQGACPPQGRVQGQVLHG